MTFHKIHNDLLNAGSADGQLPVIGAGNKLPSSLLDTGTGNGKIPLVGSGDKLPTSLLDVGNNANQLVQLDGSGKIPALDGSLLTNLPAPAGVGSWNLIEEQNASNSAQIDFTSGIDNTYKLYKIVIASLIMAHDNNWPAVRFSTDGGVTYQAANYSYSAFRVDQGGTGVNSTPGVDVWIDSGGGTGFGSEAGEGGFIEFTINDPSNPNMFTHIYWDKMSMNGSGEVNRVIGAGVWKGGTPPVNAIRFVPQSGAFASGNFKLYGIS